ncbi:MAG: PIN domain-containing protein [Anaerolineales bacterium]|nr:MAG: PIN domain-containing protein [Anaerolineales bacterium]
MEHFRERLTSHAVIGLDTNIFIYHLEAHPRYQPLTQELLAGIQAGRQMAITSTVTVMELTVRPWQVGRPAVARKYEALLVHFPHLILADVTRDVARRAAQLRARYRLRPADALQVATALVHGATAFVTNDQQLRRLTPVLDIIILDDFALP